MHKNYIADMVVNDKFHEKTLKQLDRDRRAKTEFNDGYSYAMRGKDFDEIDESLKTVPFLNGYKAAKKDQQVQQTRKSR